MIVIRCEHINRSGWVCGRILFKYEPDTTGVVQVKCSKCGQVIDKRLGVEVRSS